MSLNCFSLPCKSCPTVTKLRLHTPTNKLNFTRPNSLSFPYSSSASSLIRCRLDVSFQDMAALAQNKVLIAAGVSAAIGQFSKPFTSVMLYSNNFDIKAVIQAGGFPSTHSSAVVATATSLALERGFSDSIFGLTLVYAGLVMYDAQGVRREVGIHAKTINKVLLAEEAKTMVDPDNKDTKESVSINSVNHPLSEESDGPINELAVTSLLVDTSLQESLVKESGTRTSYTLLKESIGHTEVEVVAGALLGFVVSLAVHAIM